MSGGYLTVEEESIISRLGEIWNDLCCIVGDGPTRDGDLSEAILHIHALQHTVMAQAAARAYPSSYRRLGEIIHRQLDDEVVVP